MTKKSYLLKKDIAIINKRLKTGESCEEVGRDYGYRTKSGFSKALSRIGYSSYFQFQKNEKFKQWYFADTSPRL